MSKSQFKVVVKTPYSGGTLFLINEVIEGRFVPFHHFGVNVDSVMACCGLRQVQGFYMNVRYSVNPPQNVEIPEETWQQFYKVLKKSPISSIGHIIFLLNQTQMEHPYAKKFIEITGARVLEEFTSHTTRHLLTIFRADLKGRKYPTKSKSGENNA